PNVILIRDQHLADQAGGRAERDEHTGKPDDEEQRVDHDRSPEPVPCGGIRELVQRQARDIRDVRGDEGKDAGGHEGEQPGHEGGKKGDRVQRLNHVHFALSNVRMSCRASGLCQSLAPKMRCMMIPRRSTRNVIGRVLAPYAIPTRKSESWRMRNVMPSDSLNGRVTATP